MVSNASVLASAATRDGLVVPVTKAERKVDFGAGQGVKWPDHVNAPFVDMVYYTSEPGFNIGGTPKLLKFYEDTGVKFFNLGFIQSTRTISNGKVDWGWGAYPILSERNPSDAQYQGIKQSIKEIREVGGDVTVSFGGLNNECFWQTTQDVDVLASTYIEIIEGYGLTRIDLDVEGGAQNKAQNIANAKAIKKAQEATGVQVVLTLPVLPDGLTSTGLGVLEAYLANGVDLACVNIMTMCYGSGVLLPGENYGTASLRAVDSLKDQLKTYYKTYANTTLDDEDAYAKIGTTVSIGFESGSDPIFPPSWSKLVVDHAIEKQIGMTSFWSMNRDAKLDPNQGINGKYEHTAEFKRFGLLEPGPGGNNSPKFSGVGNKTIRQGLYFNPLYAVTAIDKEDGDLTDKIVVTGSVNVQVEGTYDVTYSVTDSEGATTTKVSKVTVKKKQEISGEAYDANTIYRGGEIVLYNGALYKCNWWSQGENPETSGAWTKVSVDEEWDVPTTIEDLAKVGVKYNKVKNGEGYDALCDYNTDGIIDLFDLVIVAKRI